MALSRVLISFVLMSTILTSVKSEIGSYFRIAFYSSLAVSATCKTVKARRETTSGFVAAIKAAHYLTNRSTHDIDLFAMHRNVPICGQFNSFYKKNKIYIYIHPHEINKTNHL